MYLIRQFRRSILTNLQSFPNYPILYPIFKQCSHHASNHHIISQLSHPTYYRYLILLSHHSSIPSPITTQTSYPIIVHSSIHFSVPQSSIYQSQQSPFFNPTFNFTKFSFRIILHSSIPYSIVTQNLLTHHSPFFNPTSNRYQSLLSHHSSFISPIIVQSSIPRPIVTQSSNPTILHSSIQPFSNLQSHV